MSRVLLPLFLLPFIAACATSPEGRQQLVAPAPLQGFSAAGYALAREVSTPERLVFRRRA